MRYLKGITLVLITLVTIFSLTSVKGNETTPQTINNIVIFIKFNDEDNYQAPGSLTYYENLLNGETDPSMQGYYLEASYGQTLINSHVLSENNEIIFYEDNFDRAYYQAETDDNPIGYENYSEQVEREHRLINKAFDYAKSTHLFDDLDLDVNGDNIVDAATFLFSGEYNEGDEIFWPHL